MNDTTKSFYSLHKYFVSFGITELIKIHLGKLDIIIFLDFVTSTLFFDEKTVLPHLVGAAAAANLDPWPQRTVNTHPSSKKIHVTFLPHFPGT